MKKAMLLASLAALSISGNAMALLADANVDHAVIIDGLPSGSIRILALTSTPTPLGAPFGAAACSYLLRWSPNAFGAMPLGNAVPCLLNEKSNVQSFGCFFDSKRNFSTTAFAGPGDPILGTPFCAGYDQYNISHLGNVTLVLGEVADPVIGLGFPLSQPGPKPPPVPGFPVLVGSVCFDGMFPVAQSITITACV